METVSRLQRSSHTAFIHDGALFVWGGYQVVDNQEVLLPSAELWTCDLESRTWRRRQMGGDVPPDLLGSCSSYLHHTLYIFGGTDTSEYSNQMFSVDLAAPSYSWRRLTDIKGSPPSPRDRHTCWVHRDRIIYFGGYGCKTMWDVQNTPTANFLVEEMSWATIGNTLFRFWGWNNEVHVFETRSGTWSHPETQGSLPLPRDGHASALQGNKGYISGGLEATELDIFCLDLDTWTWTSCPAPRSRPPLGRSMFTMTALSDGSLFVFGGLGANGETLKDAWRFDPQGAQWTEVHHPHGDKPRVSHSACLGNDDDVVVFGGSSNISVVADLVTVLRVPSPHHCHDVLVFQTQPYSLHRLCVDLISGGSQLFGRQLDWLPLKLRRKIERRAAFFCCESAERSAAF
ncbi:kelch domain-containing protein 1-like [Nelusetta ayraudi]|uniref:kelch domain-containing protein 1-like n=1 Tax=Nelusetta ayraudi TaxID=303726 RepID=UPI003F6E8343